MWTIGNVISTVGDWDGNGYDNFFIQSSWGQGIIGRTTASTALKTQTQRGYNCGNADDISCHSSMWGGWLVRESSIPVTSISDGTSAAYLLIRSPQ